MPTNVEDMTEGFSPFAPAPPPAGEPSVKKERKKRGPKSVGFSNAPISVKSTSRRGAVIPVKMSASLRAPVHPPKAGKKRQSRELRLPVSALFDAASGLKVEDGKLCYAMIEQLQGVSKQSRRRIVNALNRIFS
jgi:hypothetical protein